MLRKGPDSLEGWFVALICCLVSTLMFGSAGLSSMLFVASIDRYEADRNAAAFPFILCNVLQAATGPFAGFFASKYGERCVLLVGSILAFVGIATCYLAESIAAVTALWGVVFGIGFGFSTLLLPAIINNFFVKNRSAALGICFLGSPIGFLIFPPAFELLLLKFGLSGTFLILAGINAHCIPLCLFLRQPNFKANSASNLLDHSKQKFTYSSTGSTLRKQEPEEKSIVNQRIEIENYNKQPRRFSLEFLWHQASFSKRKQYILNLNEKCYGTLSRKNDCSRSFDMGNNFYESRDSLNLLSSSTLGSLSNTEELKFQNGASTNRAIATVSSNHIDNSYMNLYERQNYKHFSSIYFGTYQQSSFTDGVKEDSGYNSNSLPNLLSSTTKYVKDSNYNTLCAENKDSSCISSLASLKPLIDDPVSNKKFQSIDQLTDISVKASIFEIYCNPIFILMSIANAIFNLQFSTVVIVILDFSRDHLIDSSYDKFIMMCISLLGAVGMTSFGWVTDGGYLSRNKFASLCLLIGSICTAVLPFTIGFTGLIVVLAFWCVSQSSFVLLIPAIIAEYFDEDTQTIAVSACNVLCAPLYLIIPPLIGYFRDYQGCYDSIFYLLSGLSFVNSLAVLVVPCVINTKRYTVSR